MARRPDLDQWLYGRNSLPCSSIHGLILKIFTPNCTTHQRLYQRGTEKVLIFNHSSESRERVEEREQRNIKGLGSYGKHGRSSSYPGQMNNA